MCQAKGRNIIRGRGPSACLPHLTSLDTIHRHPPGNSPLLSGVHPAIICIIQKRPVRQGRRIFIAEKDTQVETLQQSRMNCGGTQISVASRRLILILDSIYWLQQGNNFLECVYNITKAHCRAFRQGRAIHASRADMTRGRKNPSFNASSVTPLQSILYTPCNTAPETGQALQPESAQEGTFRKTVRIE